jgi:hypothetical protein
MAELSPDGAGVVEANKKLVESALSLSAMKRGNGTNSGYTKSPPNWSALTAGLLKRSLTP